MTLPTAANQEREALAERIRAAFRSDSALGERRMFGALCFMFHDRMIVAALKKGDLLVRVDPDSSEALLSRPGTSIAEMGAGRSMGPGWLQVEGSVLDDDALAFWIDAALSWSGKGTGLGTPEE